MITVASNEARRILKLIEGIKDIVGGRAMVYNDIAQEMEEIEKSARQIIKDEEKSNE